MFIGSKYSGVFALMLLLFSTGCVGSAVQATPTAAPILIRVGYSSDKDLGDVPSLMAHERLSEQGYQIEPTFYVSPDLAMAAAAEGKTDIIYGGPKTMWLAADKGAPLTLIGEQNASTLLVEVVDSIQTCADLADKTFGIHSEAATTTSMLKRYLQDNCPGTQPQFIVVAGSDNRAAGLLAGQLQAAVLEVADAVQLELKAPAQFHVLSDFSHDLPNLVIYGTSVNTNFAAQQPAAVKAYLKTNLEVNRTIAADHALLLHAAARLLDQDEDSLKPLVDRYFELNAWDQNGGLTAEKVAYNYDFLVSLGDFKVSLTSDQLADLSYLNAVLAELGRR